MRMNKTSIANLMVADFIKFELFECGPSVLVSVWRSGNCAYLQGGTSGDDIAFSSVSVARRSIKRFRPDLEPTTI